MPRFSRSSWCRKERERSPLCSVGHATGPATPMQHLLRAAEYYGVIDGLFMRWFGQLQGLKAHGAQLVESFSFLEA